MPPPADTELPGAVLFACNLNAVRSPMAAGLLRHLLGHRIYVSSAGVRSGKTDPFAVSAMEEIGIDISAHTPVSFEDLHDSSFDLVISLTPQAQHQAVEMTRTMALDVEYWPTYDPTLETGNREQRLDAYRQLRESLLTRIKERFAIRGQPNP
ncbi:MAG TPA: low molecular weight phosphatase family protein [Rhizobiales bacterium]|nr:low molecular weight phosphatase family protein [Hyphomicrobiales bacterium]